MPPHCERSRAGPEQQAPEERPGIEEQARSNREAFEDDREGQEMRRDTPFKKEWDERTPRRDMDTADENPVESKESDAHEQADISDTRPGSTGEVVRERGGEKGKEDAYTHQPGQMSRRAPSDRNQAKQLAHALLGRLPVIYGGGIFRGVAHRWKTQLNENAKVWSMWDVIPEINHNAVVGYAQPDAVRRLAVAVLLKPQHLHDRVALRYQLTSDVLNAHGVESITVQGQGRSPIAQVLLTTLLGDYVSYYLALLQGIDPSPTQAIDTIKIRLKQPANGAAIPAPVL